VFVVVWQGTRREIIFAHFVRGHRIFDGNRIGTMDLGHAIWKPAWSDFLSIALLICFDVEKLDKTMYPEGRAEWDLG